MACKRCGTCCVVNPCKFSGIDRNNFQAGRDICPHLTIHEDITTSCERMEEVDEWYTQGSGYGMCDFQWVESYMKLVPQVKELLAKVYKQRIKKENTP